MKRLWLFVVLTASVVWAGSGQAIGPEKTIVFWGDVYNNPVGPDKYMPVDGTVVVPWVKEGKLGWFFFSDTFIPPESYQGLFGRLREQELQNFTSPLLWISVVPGTCDWFDDVAWSRILERARIVTELCRAARYPGLVFDTEQYQGQPFNYNVQPQADQHGFDAYADQAFTRGRQFMTAVTQVKPDVMVMLTYAASLVAEEMARGMRDPRSSAYGLIPAFLDGLLEGAGDAATVVDGYEQAYGFRTHAEFVAARRSIKEAAAMLSRNPPLYKQRLKIGYGLWLDYGNVFDWEDFEKNYYTPAEFAHALHYGLREADTCVWIYMGTPDVNAKKLPEPYLRAIRDAREPQDLDFVPRSGTEWKARQKAAREKKPEDFPKARGRPETADEVVFKRLQGQYEEVMDLRGQWVFRTDADDVGRAEQWFAVHHPDGEWSAIEIAEWWEPQGYVYDGYAWYRRPLDVPDTLAGKTLMLAFGAVDEQAWVYVNGTLAGEHAQGPPGWNAPFEIDVTAFLKPGETNLIAVRVHDSAGAGGIWKAVKLMTPRTVSAL
jgi:hypothetical protein